MGGKVCLRILAWPRLLSGHPLRMLSWSESMSCMLSRPWLGRLILGREPSWTQEWSIYEEHNFINTISFFICLVSLVLPWWCVWWSPYPGPWLCPVSSHPVPSCRYHTAPGGGRAPAGCGLMKREISSKFHYRALLSFAMYVSPFLENWQTHRR